LRKLESIRISSGRKRPEKNADAGRMRKNKSMEFDELENRGRSMKFVEG
jgi:hypothetical protein